MKKLFIIITLFFMVNFSFYSEMNIDFFENEKYQENRNGADWTYEVQTFVYCYYLEKKDFDSLQKFYTFIKELDKDTFGTLDFANPVIIALEKYRYNAYLNVLYEKIPDAFERNAYDGNIYLPAPIIYAINTNILSNVSFFFDKNISIEMKEDLFGSLDRGGSRFNFGFNLLTAIDNPNGNHIKEYLISKGFAPEEVAPKREFILRSEQNVYSEPGTSSICLGRLYPSTKIKALKYTNYKKNGYQWVQIQYDNKKTGWVIDTALRMVLKKNEMI
ncbi:MAG: SH3 domain-containing protein [Treponema sp.]|nr:SH3 domain-containing protein [Treponema sp.]